MDQYFDVNKNHIKNLFNSCNEFKNKLENILSKEQFSDIDEFYE